MRLFALLAACLFALPLAAQDRAGNDTPGEWIVDHQRAFGLWDSLCDHRQTGDLNEERCYLRYVEVFSARPKFGAQFAFITPGPRIEFGTEPGTQFDPDGFRIERGGATVWALPQTGCLIGQACVFEGPDAARLLSEMIQGGIFAFDFIDRHGAPQSLRWDLAPFADAPADFSAEAAKRGL